MDLRSISCVYFSPTGTTKKICESIAKGINTESVEMIDITMQSFRDNNKISIKSDLVILATPVYYGRVPQEITSYLASIKAEKKPVVLIVVYGNREIEDSLKELNDIAKSSNLIPIAGGEFVGEHSYSTSDLPIAEGRPDESDLTKAFDFGTSVREKMNNIGSIEQIETLNLPGKFPYVEPVNLYRIKEARKVVDFTPETDSLKCTECGTCAEVCPSNAISADDYSKTDKHKCFLCFACVKECPEQSRQMNDSNFKAAIKMLHEITQERREPEYYY